MVLSMFLILVFFAFLFSFTVMSLIFLVFILERNLVLLFLPLLFFLFLLLLFILVALNELGSFLCKLLYRLLGLVLDHCRRLSLNFRFCYVTIEFSDRLSFVLVIEACSSIKLSIVETF